MPWEDQRMKATGAKGSHIREPDIYVSRNHRSSRWRPEHAELQPGSRDESVIEDEGQALPDAGRRQPLSHRPGQGSDMFEAPSEPADQDHHQHEFDWDIDENPRS